MQNAILRATVRSYLWLSICDCELRAKLTLDYGIGCNPMVVNVTFYPAIKKPNAHLITDGIAQTEPEGPRLTNGRSGAARYAEPVHRVHSLYLLGRSGHRLDRRVPKQVPGRFGHAGRISIFLGRFRETHGNC